ncbi:PKD-like family lipoprotein [Chitinophaga sedimenti]|uniref:PKD-like family lipoprotein n=1 Tax=Chitinophaga sedimenti TaxID=2033606 RepID=UPI0020046E27|nr:PKD-like family lipoprotein [Chitinophaga sedimenti]MCK7558213.1 PKD-like family lipoprotein [Chitinophaga sedimenti]
MKLKYILSGVSLALLVAGCYKDKGNYDYIDVNRITITDTSKTALAITIGDSLKITPVVSQSIATNEDSLSYEWMVYDNSPASSYALPKTVISTQKNLRIVVSAPPFTLGQNYRLTYRVTDKRTGVSSAYFYGLTVVNKYATGWMVLEDKPTGGDLSMIMPGGVVERNVYSLLNAGAPIGKPVKLDMTIYSVTDGYSTESKEIHLLSENGAVELNYQTMVKLWDFSYLFFSPPSVIKPQRLFWAMNNTTSPSQGIIINDGKIHSNMVGGFPGTKKFGQQLTTPAGDYNYRAAPFVAGGTTYTAVAYDQIGQRFFNIGTSKLQTFPTVPGALFDMNNIGMEMLYMDTANVTREYNAVMKDAASNPWLLRFKLVVAANQTQDLSLQKVQMNAPGILNMTGIASSTLTPHIYYAVGGTINRYETTSNSTIQKFTFPAGETVTQLKYKRNQVTGSELLAITWDGTQGRVYFFDLNTVGDFTSYRVKYEGFGRIVDIALKIP